MRKRSLSYRALLGLPVGANLKTHRTYRIWAGMCNRTQKPWHHAHARYKDLGAHVCPEWLGADGFRKFLRDMGHPPSAEHSLERRNNWGDYTRKNCFWATATQQNQNKRDTHRVETPFGVVCAAEAARLMHLPTHVVYRRLKKGLRGAALFDQYQPRS